MFLACLLETLIKIKSMKNIFEKKIFIVDDDPFCRNIYQQYLISLGYQDLKLFEKGNDCLEQLNQQPEVILLDHDMEGISGIEVLKKIKRIDPNIYVVFLSGQEAIINAVNALKYGAFDYIVKGGNEYECIKNVLDKIEAVKAEMKKRTLMNKFFSIV